MAWKCDKQSKWIYEKAQKWICKAQYNKIVTPLLRTLEMPNSKEKNMKKYLILICNSTPVENFIFQDFIATNKRIKFSLFNFCFFFVLFHQWIDDKQEIWWLRYIGQKNKIILTFKILIFFNLKNPEFWKAELWNCTIVLKIGIMKLYSRNYDFVFKIILKT